MSIYENDYENTHVKTVEQGIFVRNLNEAYNNRHEKQKQAVRKRRNGVVNYLKETGDKNTLHISEMLSINIYTLLSDLRSLGYHTKGGFIV